MRFQLTRDFYIPKGDDVTVRTFDDIGVVVYLHTGAKYGRPVAMGFAGKAQKPTFHYNFPTDARRDAFIESFVERRRANVASKAIAVAERRAFRHTLRVGDVLRSVWGYDQTNVDYYQVTALKGSKQVVARRIRGMSETTGYDTGKSAPDVDNFIESEKAKTYLVGHGNTIRVASFAHASPVPCQVVGPLKVYEAARWSSYA
jgi:hypothetical protein